MRFDGNDRTALIIGLSLIVGLVLMGALLNGGIRYAGRMIGRGICRAGAGGENVAGVPCP